MLTRHARGEAGSRHSSEIAALEFVPVTGVSREAWTDLVEGLRTDLVAY